MAPQQRECEARQQETCQQVGTDRQHNGNADPEQHVKPHVYLSLPFAPVMISYIIL
jgi:hypothetical protein